MLIKNGLRACGSGGALTTAPLVQSKSYFEVKIQQGGSWSIGLANQQTDLNKTKGGQDKDSWCLCSDNIIYNNGKEIQKLTEKENDSTVNNIIEMPPTTLPPLEQQHSLNNTKCGIPSEGDTIGVSYDHIELNFYLNGKNLEVPVASIKGNVYPVIYVDEGAILDMILDNFNHNPPLGFDRIMIEQSLL